MDSLAHKSCLVVSSSLWNHDPFIQNLILGQTHNDFIKEAVHRVISLVDRLNLPNPLKLMVANLVPVMGGQIYFWKFSSDVSQFCFFKPIDFHSLSKPVSFVWTEKGTLDLSKIARLMIDCSSDKIFCFRLACIFCLEDIILKLWPDVCDILPKDIGFNLKELMTSMITPDLMTADFVFTSFWTCLLRGEISQFLTANDALVFRNYYAFGFFLTLSKGCVPAYKYFVQKIDPMERKGLLLHALNFVCEKTIEKILYRGDVFLFLFSLLEEFEINDILRRHSYAVLYALHWWPYHDSFMTFLNSSWKYLLDTQYLDLLQDIIDSVGACNLTDVYKTLFIQFWKSTPPHFKQYVIQKSVNYSFLSRLFRYENIDDLIQLILNDCNPEERKKILFNFESMNTCDFLVRKERWHTLSFFVKSCLSSHQDLKEFIHHYQLYRPYYYYDSKNSRVDILIEKIKDLY